MLSLHLHELIHRHDVVVEMQSNCLNSKFRVLNGNLMVETNHLPIVSCDCVIGRFMAKRTLLARASAASFWL
jgi:hypothetical protein